MDTLAHAVYGATLFSRSGLAGGRRGAWLPDGRRPRWDPSAWVAFGFGLLPDMASIGPHFLAIMLGHLPHDIHAIPGEVMGLYGVSHNLLVALGMSLLLWRVRRSMAVPSLAWSFHLLMDALTHGNGHFQVPMLYPLSNLTVNGINWWEHGWLFLSFWGILPGIWVGLVVWRRRGRRQTVGRLSGDGIGAGDGAGARR